MYQNLPKAFLFHGWRGSPLQVTPGDRALDVSHPVSTMSVDSHLPRVPQTAYRDSLVDQLLPRRVLFGTRPFTSSGATWGSGSRLYTSNECIEVCHRSTAAFLWGGFYLFSLSTSSLMQQDH